MPILFFENFTKSYYAPIVSMSSCICLLLAIVTIVLPFFAAFATDGKNIFLKKEFWKNISSYYTHPVVNFNNQFMLHVMQNDETYFFSSVLKLNDFYENVLSFPLVKTETIDENSDNLIDKIKIKITFQSDPSTVKNIKLMLFFDYALIGKVKLSMQTMCTLDIDSPNGASYIYTNGMLELKQKSPISSGTIARTLYYTDIFKNSTSPFDFIGIYKDFTERNITTVYNYDKLVMPFRSNRETELDIEITVPSYQEVVYLAPLLTTLKFAWIQYFSLLVPTAIIIYLILLFIFRYQIFESSVINDLPKKSY